MSEISHLEQQADILFNNIAGWESSTLQRIGKRIGKYGKMSLADVKAINNIAVVKQDMKAITKELARVTGLNVSQIEKIYGDLLTEQHLKNKPLYDYRKKAFIPFADNKELQALVKAYARTTGETMINLAKTTSQNLGVVKTLDNGQKVFEPLQEYYSDALDKAVMQVASGATDFHTAMRDTIVELGGSGMRVNYANGYYRRLDTAVRQSLLWGAKQASIEYNEMIGEELGCDGYEIDYHSNPRPSHAFMQGKQFCSGKTKTIMGKEFPGMEDTRSEISGKNVNEALEEYGCLHYKTPILCGISEPRYSNEQLAELNRRDKQTYDIDGKTMTGYEATQAMRRLETDVRNQKTIRDTARASGDNELSRECTAKIKAYQAKYDEICDITGFAKETKRMSVPKHTQ
jgi:hypothetical protein